MTHIDYSALFLYAVSTYTFDMRIRFTDGVYEVFDLMLNHTSVKKDLFPILNLLSKDGSIRIEQFYEAYQLLKNKYKAKEMKEQEDEYTIPSYSLLLDKEKEQQFLNNFELQQIEGMKRLAFYFYTFLQQIIEEQMEEPVILSPMDARMHSKVLFLGINS